MSKIGSLMLAFALTFTGGAMAQQGNEVSGAKKIPALRVQDNAVIASTGVGLAVRPLTGKEPDTWGPRLPVHAHRGKFYLEAKAGQEYGLEFISNRDRRLFATSIDGVSIMDGKTADENGGGYVVTPAESLYENVISGWRDGSDAVHRFVFAPSALSYASLTGRPTNVGVIGAVVFEESVPELASSGPKGGMKGGTAGGTRGGDGIGTGFGERAQSRVTTTKFERGSRSAAIVIHYGTRQQLLQAGVIPRVAPLGEANPFPATDPVPSVPPPSAYRRD